VDGVQFSYKNAFKTRQTKESHSGVGKHNDNFSSGLRKFEGLNDSASLYLVSQCDGVGIINHNVVSMLSHYAKEADLTVLTHSKYGWETDVYE